MPRRRRPTAGKKLREELDALLARVSREKYPMQPALEWSEQELQVIERAMAAADRAEVLGRLWEQEMDGTASTAVLVKLSAEMRACEKAVVDMVSKVNPDVGEAKSARHVQAARSRWDRRAGGA